MFYKEPLKGTIFTTSPIFEKNKEQTSHFAKTLGTQYRIYELFKEQYKSQIHIFFREFDRFKISFPLDEMQYLTIAV